MDIDIPWKDDPLREHPDKRQFFFDWYVQELRNYGFPFDIISGNQKERLMKASEIIQNLTTA
jgi:nicotinamide riboside kinase